MDGLEDRRKIIMAQPFFKGNYGSALARVDTRPIIEAGRAQGAMYANLGNEVAGAIKQYGLNKEKRQKEEDTAMGNLANFSPEDLLALETTNPKLGQALKRATTEQASPRDFQLINSASAPFVAAKGRERDARLQEATIVGKEFENKFNEVDKDNRLLRSTIETEGAELINSLREKQIAVADIEMQLKSNELGVNKEKLQIDLDKAKESLESVKQDVTTKRNNNSFFAEQLDMKRTEFALGISESMSKLAVNAEQLDQLRGSRDVDQKIKEENLRILEAERKQLQLDLTTKQNLMSSFSSNVNQVDKDDPMYKQFASMNLGDAFQGDIPGYFLNAVGNLGGLVGAELTPETATEGQKIESLNALLKPALVAQLSSRPSNYTLETIKKFMPQKGDSNQVGKTKLVQLIPILQNRAKEAISTVQSGKSGTSYYQDAKEQAVLLPKIIQGLEAALVASDSDASTGTTSNNVGFTIKGRR